MPDFSAKELSFIEMMKLSPDHARKGFEILAMRPDLQRFFEPLVKAGFFAPEQNPKIQQAEQPGYYRVPYWDALEYLVALAKTAGEKNDVDLAEQVMQIVRAATDARDPERDNYHTARKFAEVLGLVPTAAVKLVDIEMVGLWLDTRFHHGTVTRALDTGAMRNFVAGQAREDWLKALGILRHCTSIRWVQEAENRSERRKAVAIADPYWLREMTRNHLSNLAAKLPSEATNLFYERVREVFGEPGRNEMSWLLRPTVEDHHQNRTYQEVENLLVEGLRDALLVWIDREPQTVEPFVVQMLTGTVQMIRRVAIHVISERWPALRRVYREHSKPSLFDAGHLHELYGLLKKNFHLFAEAEKDSTVAAIRQVPLPEGDDAERRLKRIHMRWLSAVVGNGYEPAETWFREITADPEIGRLSAHPDFNSYMQVRVGPGPSPYSLEELVSFAEDGSLVTKLNDFRQKNVFESPTLDALVQSLQDAVAQHPESFIDLLPQFVQAVPTYQWAVINGFKRLWNQSTPQNTGIDWTTSWPKLISFFETLLAEDSFSKDAGTEEVGTPAETGIPTIIADFLQDGTRDDAKSFAPELLPRTLPLIMTLLARTPKVTEPGKDPVLRAINAPRGRVIEALVSHVLRSCRIEEKATGKHEVTWNEMKATFENELAMCKSDNYEFSTLAGQYLTHFDWMSHEWLSGHVKGIFPLEFPENFTCAVSGLAYAVATRSTSDLLRDNGILDAALKLPLEGDSREKLVQRIALAYLWGDDDLNSPRMSSLFGSNAAEDLQSAAELLRTAQPDELGVEQRDRIFRFWEKCVQWAQQTPAVPAEVLSTLSHLVRLVDAVDERTCELLFAVAPHVHVGHRSYEFINELNRLVDRNPAEITAVLKKMLDATIPDFDYKDRLKTLLVKIADSGRLQDAIGFAEQLRKDIPGMLQLYGELITRHHRSAR